MSNANCEDPYSPKGEPHDDFQRFDPRWIQVERISAGIVWLILFGLSLIPLTLFGIWLGGFSLWLVLACLATLGLLLALGWFMAMLPVWQHERSGWRLTQQGLEIRMGLWWRRELSVPKARVQHTDVSQGPLLRKYQLAKLIVHTAGTTNASVEFPGLSYETACRLRDQLVLESQRGKKDVV